MEKQEILELLNPLDFYKRFVPTLKENSRGEAMGVCPFHDDVHPSLSVNLDNGLYHCFGCGVAGDVFNFYRRLKGVDFKVAFEEIGKIIGLRKKTINSKVVARFDYYDESGLVVYWKERLEPGRNGRKKEFLFYHTEGEKNVLGRGRTPIPYNLPELVKGDGPIYCLEGEAKAELLRCRGLNATCLDSGANSPWRNEYLPYFIGKDIVLLPDNDQPGRSFTDRIAAALAGHAKSIKIIELPGLPEKGDILDWVKDLANTKEKFLEIVESSKIWNPGDQRDDHDDSDVISQERFLSDTDLLPTIPLPFDIFPPSLKQFFFNLAETLQVPPEIPAGVALSIIAGAVGNKVAISPKRGWKEAIFQWLATIEPTGNGKSPVINTLMAPIFQIQDELSAEFKEMLILWEDFENDKKSKKKKRTAAHTSETQKPVLRHIYTSDSTIEALGHIFSKDGHGLIVHKDELAGLICGMNQYKKGSGDDRQKYLQLFDCRPFKIDRVSESLNVKKCGCSIIGGIQPGLFSKIFKEDFFIDGFLPRFLMIYQEWNPSRFSEKALDEKWEIFWNELIRKCFFAPWDPLKSQILTFSEEGLKIFGCFYDEFQTIRSLLSERAQPFIPKLITYSLRLIGLLHIIEGLLEEPQKVGPGEIPWRPIIQPETVEKGIRLTRFFAGQMSKVLFVYGKGKQPLNGQELRLIHALFELQEKVKNGRLPLSVIREAYNDGLPSVAVLEQDNKRLSGLIHSLGLETKRGAEGYATLIWDYKKLQNIFKNNVTNITNVTPSILRIDNSDVSDDFPKEGNDD
jgi:hypothetical protein